VRSRERRGEIKQTPRSNQHLENSIDVHSDISCESSSFNAETLYQAASRRAHISSLSDTHRQARAGHSSRKILLGMNVNGASIRS
jgi:hypothetical protein